jgi:hypothetical protein
MHAADTYKQAVTLYIDIYYMPIHTVTYTYYITFVLITIHTLEKVKFSHFHSKSSQRESLRIGKYYVESTYVRRCQMKERDIYLMETRRA